MGCTGFSRQPIYPILLLFLGVGVVLALLDLLGTREK